APPSLIVVRAVERNRGLAPSTYAGDEIRRVDEQVSGALRLPEGCIEERQRRDLAAEDRRLCDLPAFEPATDLRIRAHAFGGPQDGDLRLREANEKLHLQGCRLAGTECDVLDLAVAESRLGYSNRVFSRNRQRGYGSAPVAGRNGLSPVAGCRIHD